MDTVIQTIKKLLELADENKNSSQGERDNAMATVHALLAKHNLSLAQVSEPTYEASAFETQFQNKPWIRHVLGAVCEVTFTRLLSRTVGFNNKKILVLLGTTTNVESATLLSKSLIESIKKESKAATKQAKNKAKFYNVRFDEELYKKSFCIGAALALQLKAVEMNKAEQADPESTALIVVTNALQQANDDYIKGKGIPEGRMRVPKVEDKALNDGFSFGNTLDFSITKGSIGSANGG